MTNYLPKITSPAARLFVERCIEELPISQDDWGDLWEVENVFEYSFVRYLYSDFSFVRQMHITTFPEDGQPVAVIYLMFSDGHVQGIKLTMHSRYQARNVCAIADEIGRIVQESGDCIDANERKSKFITLLAQKKIIGLNISAFQYESYTPTIETLSAALDSISHVLLRTIDVKTKLNPTEIEKFRTLVAESFLGFSNGSDKLAEFAKHLDADVVAAIGEIKRVANVEGLESWRNFSFNQLYPFSQLYQYNYFAVEDSILKQRRIQAMSAFPWMAPCVMEYWQGLQKFSPSTNFDHALSRASLCHWGQQLSDAIDVGRPLLPAAATLFGVPEEVIEWSTGRPIIFQAPPSLKRINDLLRILSFIRRENRPIYFGDWLLLEMTLKMIVLAFRFCLDDGHNAEHAYSVDEGIAKLLAIPKIQQILQQRFEELNQRKSSIPGTHIWSITHFYVDDYFFATLRDAIKARYAESYSTESIEMTRPSAILMAWQAERTLRDIANISWRWYRELREELALSGDASVAVLPIVLEKPFEFDDLNIVQITNYKQLSEEVKAMHCDVFEYVDFYLVGASQIFSIRNQDNARLSTLELKSKIWWDDAIGVESPIEVVSHHGFKKAKPSDLCKKAATALIDFLNEHDYSKVFEDFNRIAQANHFRKKDEVRKRKSPIADFDIVAEAIAWRCAFPSEKKAKSFLKKFR